MSVRPPHRRKFAEPLDWAVLFSVLLHALIIAIQFGVPGGSGPADPAMEPQPLSVTLADPVPQPESTDTPAPTAAPLADTPQPVDELTVTLAPPPVPDALTESAPEPAPAAHKAVRTRTRTPVLTAQKGQWDIAAESRSQAPPQLADAAMGDANVDVPADASATPDQATPPSPLLATPDASIAEPAPSKPDANDAAIAEQTRKAADLAAAMEKKKAEEIATAEKQKAEAKAEQIRIADAAAKQKAEETAKAEAQAKAEQIRQAAAAKQKAEEASKAELARKLAEQKAVEQQKAAEQAKEQARIATEAAKQKADEQARTEQARKLAEASAERQAARKAPGAGADAASTGSTGNASRPNGQSGDGNGGTGLTTGPGLTLPITPPAGLSLAERALQQARQGNLFDSKPNPTRKRFATLNRATAASDVEFRFYGESWRLKVERVGAMYSSNLPKEGFYSPLQVSVTINSDGTLDSVYIRQSSGNKKLDEMAKHIVEASAPFSPFPPGMRERNDQVEITRNWNFTDGTVNLAY